MMSYKTNLETEMMQFCSTELLTYITKEQFFPCSL
jgi:spore photoproduct lyase